MTESDRRKVKVENEIRSKGISKMIGEGGLGAEKYYEVKKSPPSSRTDEQSSNDAEENEEGK